MQKAEAVVAQAGTSVVTGDGRGGAGGGGPQEAAAAGEDRDTARAAFGAQHLHWAADLNMPLLRDRVP